MALKELFISVFFAAFFSGAFGFPSGTTFQESSVGVHPHYNPEILYETYGEGVEVPSGVAKETIEETAVFFAMHKLGVRNDQVVHRAGSSSDIINHAYLSQVHDGISFVNAIANVAMTRKDGRVVAFGSSFVKPENIAPSQPSVDKKTAIATAEAALDCTYDSHPTSLQYLANPDGSASLVHVFQVKNNEAGKYYQAHVDAHSGKLLSTVNFVAEATYTAVDITKNSILDGQSVLNNPQDPKASPQGWHTDPSGTHPYTGGNNGDAGRITDRRLSYAKESSRGTYAYGYEIGDPDVGNNRDACIVNAFYVMGKVHDFTYRYGFTEDAFNFQRSNFRRGGKGNDAVMVSVNDKSDYNNAFFATPPDGRSGECTLHMFNLTQPFRPTAMENSVLVHEFGHGLSNRLVGGGTAACLISLESQGLGEGWSDTLADWTAQTSKATKDFTLGTYVIPRSFRQNGFRDYPYSTGRNVNPRTYSDVGRFNEPHYIGEVWANILHNVYAMLVATHGYSPQAMTNPDGTEGNVVFMHLFIDSLSILHCYPTFITARNAFIQADINRYKGRNFCLLWRAFASRGLGYGARPYVNNGAVPPDCVNSRNVA